jgi:sporulation protein YlmC with PRC-barrel domain
MTRFVIARQLGGKRSITTTGKEIGRLDDIVVDESTGEMEGIVVEPDAETAEDVRFPKDSQGDFIIPFKAVRAISDVIVVEETPMPVIPVMPIQAQRHHHRSSMMMPPSQQE